MNTQRGFSTLLGLLLVLAVAGGAVYWYMSNETWKEGDWVQPDQIEGKVTDKKTLNDGGKKPVEGVSKPVVSVPSHTGQKRYIDPGKNFYFYHTFDVDDLEREGYIAKLSNLGGDYPEDIIYVDYQKTDLYKDEDAKFGPFQLRYNQDKKCWETYTESSKGGSTGVVFSCSTPNLYTDSGLPVFTSTYRWKTYVIPIGTDEFVRLNITGSGATKPLDDIIKSVSKF